LIDKY